MLDLGRYRNLHQRELPKTKEPSCSLLVNMPKCMPPFFTNRD
jgi:hypothetical protein